MEIRLEPGYDAPEIRQLFSDYTAMLIDVVPEMAGYLQKQDYEHELLHLREKYGEPKGRLYLLRCDGAAAGCVALRPIDEESCECKRLYLVPAFRGHRLGDVLVQRIIDDARAIGYRRMLLDTLPPLRSAIDLYRRFGFREIPQYNDSPVTDAIYMQLDL